MAAEATGPLFGARKGEANGTASPIRAWAGP